MFFQLLEFAVGAAAMPTPPPEALPLTSTPLLASALLAGPAKKPRKSRSNKGHARSSLLKQPSRARIEPAGKPVDIPGLANRIGLFDDNGSSSDEADALDTAEAEARLDPITRAHVEAFDKIKLRKNRRIKDDAYWRKQLGIEEEKEDFLVTEQDFVNLFRAHVKRKKLRRRYRAHPNFELVSRHCHHTPDVKG